MNRLVLGLTTGHHHELPVQGHGAAVAVAAVLQVGPMVPLPLLPVEQPDLGHVAVALGGAPDQQDPEFVDPEKNQ